MPDIRTALIVDLAGNLIGRSRGFGQAMTGLARAGERSFGRLGRAAAVAGRVLDRAGNRFVGLATGAAAFGAARGVVTLQRRFTRLGIQANAAAGDMDALKKQIFDTAQAPDIRVDPSEITAAVEAIVEKSGDLKFARDNLETLAKTIQATGGSGAAVGEFFAEFSKLGLKSTDDVNAAMAVFISQGKLGAFTGANLATQGRRLASAFAATGQSGKQAARELSATIQVVAGGVGSAEQATTAFEALLRTLQDADKAKLLEGNGIRLIEPGTESTLRSVPEIMKDIIKATGGNVRLIGEVFDAEAIRAFNTSITEFKQTGGFPSFDKFLAVQGDFSLIVGDSARAAGDADGALQSLSTAFQQFADRELAGPIQDLADAFNGLDKDQIAEIMDSLKTGALAAGGLILGAKAIRLIGDARNALGRRGGGGGALGGIAAAAAPVPVFVTNPGFGGGAAAAGGRTTKPGRRVASPAGAIGGGAGALGGGGRTLGRAARLLGGAAGRALPLIGLGLGAAQIGQAAAAGDARGAARAGGGLLGAAGGALIGQAAIPIPVVGALIGALAGGLGGESLGDLLGGKLEIAIKSDAPVSVTRMETNSRAMDLDLSMGATTFGPGA